MTLVEIFVVKVMVVEAVPMVVGVVVVLGGSGQNHDDCDHGCSSGYGHGSYTY